MNKQQYLDELKVRLKGLSQEEIDQAIQYCEEYFDDAGVGHEQEVIQELGSPFKFAAQMKADSEIKRQQATPKQKQKQDSSIKTIVLLILGICALPIAVPAAFVLLLLLFIAGIVLVAFLFAAVVSVIAMLFSGVPLLIHGLFSWNATSDTLLTIGGGIFSIGLAGLIIFCVIWVIKTLIPMLTRFLTNLYDKIKEKTKHEK